MKKFIIVSILALSFSSISPALAADMVTPVDVETTEESMPQVLPVAENVKPVSETIINSIDTVIIPVVLPTPCVNLCPTPLVTPPNPLPEPIKNINPVDDIITVTPPCLTTCPNPNPNPVIVPSGEIVLDPCSDVILPTPALNRPISLGDIGIVPNKPCPSVTPITEVAPTGSGGGSVFYPTNVLPVNAPAAVEITTTVPVQQVLGEQTIADEKIPVPSFPKTGAGPSVPSTPFNTMSAIMGFSFATDRKRAISIA